jgi:hypothetical protein
VDKGVGNLAENTRICGADRWITVFAQHDGVEKDVYKPVLTPV